jgi:hypothetical protein
VGRLVLGVLEPAALELSLAAAGQLQQEQDRLQKHWQQRLERCRYEVDRAQRQYQAAEPENRLVVRELEKRWEAALLEERRVQEDYDRFCQQQPSAPTAMDRELLLEMAGQIPALWHSPGTTAAERKTIVRHQVEQVVMRAPSDREKVDVTVHWAGGFTSQQELIRPVARYEQLSDYPALSQRIVALHEQKRTVEADCRSAQQRRMASAQASRDVQRRDGASDPAPAWRGAVAAVLVCPQVGRMVGGRPGAGTGDARADAVPLDAAGMGKQPESGRQSPAAVGGRRGTAAAERTAGLPAQLAWPTSGSRADAAQRVAADMINPVTMEAV